MASLRQLPNSPFWIACITNPDRSRTQRTTGVPVRGVKPDDMGGIKRALADLLDVEIILPGKAREGGGLDAREARRLAQRIAVQFEDASREARAQRLTEQRARKAITDIFMLANRDALPSSTVRSFFETWLKRKELEAGVKTHARYSAVVNDLIEFLGPRADQDLSYLSAKTITAFRDSLSKRLTPGTVNISLKVVRGALTQAQRDGLIDMNAAKNVTLLKSRRVFERKPFTLPELKRILKEADDEWRGMILVGLYCGLRLSDVATLTWNAVDLQSAGLRLTTEKTGRRVVLPLAKPLLRHLESLPAGDDPNAPLFPKASAARKRSQYGGTLSNAFYRILVAAGLAKPRTHESTGKGRDAKRELGGLSFHCLRHTATSLLKNAGVSDAVARDIIGHDSQAVSANYTHISDDAKRDAVNKLPDVLR